MEGLKKKKDQGATFRGYVAYASDNSVLKFRLIEDTHEQKMLENFAVQDDSQSYQKAAVDTYMKETAAQANEANKELRRIDRKLTQAQDTVAHLQEAREEAADKAADARHVIDLCEEKMQEDYDKKKWHNMKTRGDKAVCLACAAKLECSACKETHAPDQLKRFSRGRLHLCGKCEGLGYGPRALETHRCGHCTFAGGSGKFDQKSIKNANERGHRKICLQCKATKK